MQLNEWHSIDGFLATECYLKNLSNGQQIPLVLFSPDEVSDFINLFGAIGNRTLVTNEMKTIECSTVDQNCTPWDGAVPVYENDTQPDCITPVPTECINTFPVNPKQ